MLVKLHIENIALIEKLEIDFGPGLNILTGETGAGKSIVVDSITAIIGGRMSKDIIRTGEEKAVIEGLFIINNENKLDELRECGFDIEEDNSLLVEREFYLNGKNICRVNGRLVTVSMLKSIGDILVDIHGQHDNQSLLEPANHIKLLDAFIDDDLPEMMDEYTQRFNEFNKITAELQELVGNPEETARKIDLLNFQINELESAKLRKEEEEELEQKKLELANAEKVGKSLANSYELLSGSGADGMSIQSGINEVIKELNQISFVDGKYGKAGEDLQEILYHIEEIGSDIRSWRDNAELNPQLLEQIEERLDLIARLKRKYGKDLDAVLAYFEKIKEELDNLINSEDKAKELKQKADMLKNIVINIARNLSMGRKEYSVQLEEKIEQELEKLEMKNTKFAVKVDFWDEEKIKEPPFYQNGLDKVEFLISPNLGEEPKPLAKIASGGELSRVMLAIKTILAKVDSKSTLIFDEVDTGISGNTAQAVAEKLAYVSGNHQVICITHLPQIAAMADLHFDVQKQVSGDRTITRVNPVEGGQQIEVIARLMEGSNITEITLQHAEQMKQNSDKAKESMRYSG